MKAKSKAFLPDKISSAIRPAKSSGAATRRTADVRHPLTKQFQRRDIARSGQFSG